MSSPKVFHAACRLLPLSPEAAEKKGADLASGLWPAVSGASAQAQAVDTVANNIANMDTNGFKKDLPTFKEYLTSVERAPDQIGIPHGPIKDKDLYPLDGRDQAFVVVDGTYSSFRQGPLRQTNAPLDIALDGPGFFEVSTPEGVRYTRNGAFKLAPSGQLVTTEGFPVLAAQPGGLATALPTNLVQPGQGGPMTQGGVAAGQDPTVIARQINLLGFGPNVSVSEKGEIFSGDNLIGQLNVVEFQDLKKLRKQGGQLFINTDPVNRIPTPMQTVVRQGLIEGSNVNPAEEMTKLIQSHRMFEQNLKALKSYDDLMGKEANDVGKLSL